MCGFYFYLPYLSTWIGTQVKKALKVRKSMLKHKEDSFLMYEGKFLESFNAYKTVYAKN